MRVAKQSDFGVRSSRFWLKRATAQDMFRPADPYYRFKR